jgi:hypothetical protein
MSCSAGENEIRNDIENSKPKEATSGYFYKKLSEEEFKKRSMNAKNGSGEDALILAHHFIGKSLAEKRGPSAYTEQYVFWLTEGLRMKNHSAASEIINYQISTHACNSAKENLARSAQLDIFSSIDLKSFELKYSEACNNR